MYTSGYSGTVNYGQLASYTTAATGYSTPGGHSTSVPYAASQARTTYQQAETPHHSMQDAFLAPNRPKTPIISNLGEVKSILEKAYRILTGEDFPYDSITLVIADEHDFRTIYESTGGYYQLGIMGFSYNQYGKGISEIYVKQDHLDRLLLTLGHELGHVLSPTLPNKQDEEAKAHAFSLAWMETIRDHNIGGLQPNIAVNPAQNGLHDVAFNFVTYLLNTGATSLDIFKTLSQGLTSIIAEA